MALPITDEEAVSNASNALEITYTSTDTSNSVTTNVMLTTNATNGVSITWGSSVTNVIATNGMVSRPSFNQGDTNVVLTATLSKGTVTNTKSFTLTVLADGPPPLNNTGESNLIDITTLQQLNAMRYDLDGDGEIDPNVNSTGSDAYRIAFLGLDTNQIYRGYELVSNLDFAGSEWASNQSNVEGWDPIGTYVQNNTNASFTAIFEGNSNVISGLYINRPSAENVGLFGGVRENSAELRNLGLSNLWITGSNNVGGLVGQIHNRGTITASYATGTVTGSTGSENVGGLVGHSDNGRITNSYATGTVTGSNDVGGLVGETSRNGKISASYATGTVTGSQNVGGLVGSDAGRISASYATGTVTGSQRVGGLVGWNRNGTISDSYAAGTATGSQNVGGLVGLNASGEMITTSYATGTVTGANNLGDNIGGLVGENRGGTINVSYAAGTVTGSNDVGGLVGWNSRNTAIITASYATGMVTGSNDVGGLVGRNTVGASITASYFDNNTVGIRAAMSTNGTGYTTVELQAPTNYTGIYNAWNVNGDDPWDFSNTGQYPLLKVDFNGDGVATWEEFGMQNALSDAQAVALASNSLMIAYTPPDTNSNNVTTNVTLATNVGHGVSITWGSSATNVIAVSGEVTRPTFGETNATVTLTATLSKEAESATKSFTLTVIALPITDAYAVSNASNALEIGYTVGETIMM